LMLIVQVSRNHLDSTSQKPLPNSWFVLSNLYILHLWCNRILRRQLDAGVI
jgi:hypothetical protein